MGYNMTIESIRFEVPTMNHLVLNGVDSAIRPELINEIKSLNQAGVIDAKEYANTTDSIYVPINSKRIKEAVWGVQSVLDKRQMAYNLVGQYAPDLSPYKWDGYNELPISERVAAHQRTISIRQNYESMDNKIRQINQQAWETGRMLWEQREAVSHNKKGGFEGWHGAEYPQRSVRLAYHLIDVYEMYPNSATVAELKVGLTVLYQLSAKSTPESAREEIQGRVEQGEKITKSQAAEIIASHKLTIPDSLLWLPERLRKAVINGYFHLSIDHLQALAPLENLNTIGAPMVATMHFDKRTDIPTPQALYNRLSTLGGLSDDEVATVVKRMVAVCKPSANEVDLSDFTEDDFAEIGAVGEGEPSEFDRSETGVKGYYFVNGGKAVWCEFSNKTITLDEFEAIKAKHAKPRKSVSNGNGSGGHIRTAAEIQGDRIANGYVAQVERANDPRQFMVRELGKMDNGALVLLAAAIAKAKNYHNEIYNETTYIADFVMSEVSGE